MVGLRVLAGSVLGHRTACARLPLSVLLRGPSVSRDFRVLVLYTQRDGISCHQCPFPLCALHGCEEDIKVAHVSPASLNLLCDSHGPRVPYSSPRMRNMWVWVLLPSNIQHYSSILVRLSCPWWPFDPCGVGRTRHRHRVGMLPG